MMPLFGLAFSETGKQSSASVPFVSRPSHALAAVTDYPSYLHALDTSFELYALGMIFNGSAAFARMDTPEDHLLSQLGLLFTQAL